MAAPAGRYVPEPLTFAVDLLRSALPPSSVENPANGQQSAAQNSTVVSPALDLHSTAKASSLAEVPPLQLTAVLTKAADDVYFDSVEFKASALVAALSVVERAAALFKGAAALPEVLNAAQTVLRDLAGAEALPQVRALMTVHVVAIVRSSSTGSMP